MDGPVDSTRTAPASDPQSPVRGSGISVALATYNSARFVRAQLESILSQSQLPTQIVVGDDGSTDGSMDIVDDVMAASSRQGIDVEWTVLDGSSHLGVKRNMDRIIDACRGEIIAICDHDDICLPGRFERILEWFTDHPDDLMVCADATVIDGSGATTSPSMLSERGLSEREWSQLRSDRAFELLIRRFVAEGATSAYRRDLLEMIPPRPDVLLYDAWFALLASAMTRFGFDDRPAIEYRMHGGNASGGVRRRTRREKLAMLAAAGAERNARLFERSHQLLAGVEGVRDHVPAWAYELARASAAHQRVRADFPANRLRRAPRVLAHAATGAYGRSARGYKDVVLDLVQPIT